MGKDLPSQLSDLLLGQLRHMWSCVVVEENHAFSIDQSRALFEQGFLKTLQLLSVEVGGDGLVVVEQLRVQDASHVPPDTQHCLFRG